MVTRVLAAVMGFAARRPVAVSLAVLTLAVLGALFALRLQPSAETETLVGRSTPGYAATELLHERFGDDAVYVVVRESAVRIALGEDLGRVFGLEGCLAGNPTKAAAPPGGKDGPCARLAATKPAKVVFGPGTFINEAVGQINDQLGSYAAAQKRDLAEAGKKAYRAELAKSGDPAAAEAARAKARQKVNAGYFQLLAGLALRYGLTKVPAIDDPQFLARLIFDSTRAAGTPKARFATIFPSSQGALIQVRLRSDLSEAERKTAITNIRAATEMEQWALSDGSYAVTGAPVLIGELSDSISKSILILLVAAVIVMALMLGIVFRSRLRLLPLAIALVSVALTFGVMAISGIGLTMASIAIVPILIGLAVDYAIQLQSRFDEQGPPLTTAIGAVALTYQLPGLRRPLRLSGPTIAGIFSGKITRWDDARIREENPEATLPSLAVQPVHRSDGSGTADIFRRYLRLYTKAAATGGGETVGVVRDGNEAVVAHVKATPGAVAYVEVVYARQNRLPVAHLQNRAGRFVSPMPFEVATAATNVLDALAPLDDEGRSGFRVSLLDAPGAQSYPLASFTWMLVAPSRLSPEKCRVLNAFLHWALETAAPTTAMLGYVALPTEVANRVLADVDEQLCCGSCAPPSAHLRQEPPWPRPQHLDPPRNPLPSRPPRPRSLSPPLPRTRGYRAPRRPRRKQTPPAAW